MQTGQTIEPRRRKTAAPPATERPISKKQQLVELLRTKGGADVQQISEALGWLPHTVRAALTGLRKADVAVEKLPPVDGKPTRYRINTKRTRAAQ